MHDRSYPRYEICGLLADLGCLVVETPENGTTNLREVGLDSNTQCIHHHTKPIQHNHILWRGGGRGREGEREGRTSSLEDVSILSYLYLIGLFLKGKENPIYKLFFKTRINISCTQISQDLQNHTVQRR